MRNRITPTLLLAMRVLAFAALPLAAAQAQLPFDPSAIDQLTPEQRQKALESLGTSGSSSSTQAQPDGKFRDQPLNDPLANGGISASRSRNPDVTERNAGNNNASNNNAGNNPAARTQASEGCSPDSRSSERSTVRIDNNCAPTAQRSVVRRDAADDLVADEGGKRLKPFGYELFQRSATTFAPATDIPIPSDYVVGPGDSLRVQLFGNENGNYSLQVARDGQINFPKLGPISVAGRRFEEVKASLAERISRELIGVQSSISLGELRSIRVFLTGDVNQPGSYTVSSLASMTNALFVGGGISPVGSLRNIQLKRSGRVIRTLDLYSLLLKGDSSGDERLQPGDAIFVPPVGARVSADGEVKRPAIYELKGERTVSEIVALAGGLLASTNTGTAQIERFEGNRKTVRQVDLARNADLASRVQDGDLLRIGSIAKRLDNNVRVIGYVRYPGTFQWSEGYSLRALLQAAQIQSSDTTTETYLALGLVERTDAQSGVRGWVSFSVQAVLSQPESAFPLQRDDLVLILNRDDIAYLDSKEVRSVAAGDFAPVKGCPALEGLARLVNTERSVRFLKAFTAESARSGQGAKQFFGESTCPPIYRQAPRALQYLLEESVAVYGEVRRPGLYPVANDTPLKLLIETAGGLSNESDASNIEYISYQDALKAGSSRYRNLDLKQSGTDALKVNPGDLFNFKPLYLGQEVGTVKLAGEFRFPGSYGILRGEHLSQLVKRAGGLTAASYPYGAVFTRTSARVAEQESYRRAAADLQDAAVTALTSGALGKDAQISAQFLTTVSARLETAVAVGRIVIEADPTILEARPELDPILEPGDALVMPKRPISVTVIGQVLNPGSLAFTPGSSLHQYLDRAGGFAQAADESRVFVILPNGTAQKFKTSFWNYKSQDIPPGSVIVVPRDPAPFNALAFSERIFSVFSNLALTAAALATISR